MSYLRYLIVLLAFVTAGCVSSGGVLPEEDRPPEFAPGSNPEYRLGLVGDVLAGKRTPGEIAADTESKLLQFILTPKVSIIVEELNSAEFQNRVRVVGGVAEPKSVKV